MSKTIKIIDLLNKIANGEEVPEKIKTNNKDVWFYDKNNKYYHLDNVEYISLSFNASYKLNDKVEILEKQEEIDIQQIKEFQENIIEQVTDDGNIKCLAKKCNELVQAVKQLDKNIKEKQ